MKFSAKKIITVISRALLFIFVTNIAFAYKPQENIWKDRNTQLAALPSTMQPNSFPSATAKSQLQQELIKQIPSLKTSLNDLSSNLNQFKKKFHPQVVGNIPDTFFANVNLRDSHQGTAATTVVLLEDVHLNKEAQEHLSSAIKSFGQIPGTEPITVGLEGAQGQMLYDTWKSFSNKNIATQVANSFFETGDISGPAHAGFTSYPVAGTKGLSFWGIDQSHLYNANVQAYKDSKSLKSKAVKSLTQMKQGSDKIKDKFFNPALLSFDERVQSYRQGKIQLAEYVKFLSTFEVPTSFNVDTFLQAYAMETGFDFDRIEAERRQILEKLARNLSEKDLNNLVQTSLAYQQGMITFANYYNHLREVCQTHFIDLRSAPKFDAYIQYVLLTDGIKTESLFKEITELEKSVYSKLSTQTSERLLIAQDRQLYLTSQLLEFALTSDQWEEYAGNALLRTQIPELKPFEDFYRLAESRSQAMVESLLEKTGSQSTAIMVAGGFHTAGISNILKKKGLSYIVAAPKVTKVDAVEATRYLSVFDREKTALERIFTGQKLFLVGSVGGSAAATASNTGMIGDMIAGAAAQGQTEDLKKELAALPAFGVTANATVEVGLEGAAFTLTSDKGIAQAVASTKGKARSVWSYLQWGKSTGVRRLEGGLTLFNRAQHGFLNWGIRVFASGRRAFWGDQTDASGEKISKPAGKPNDILDMKPGYKPKGKNKSGQWKPRNPWPTISAYVQNYIRPYTRNWGAAMPVLLAGAASLYAIGLHLAGVHGTGGVAATAMIGVTGVLTAIKKSLGRSETEDPAIVSTTSSPDEPLPVPGPGTTMAVSSDGRYSVQMSPMGIVGLEKGNPEPLKMMLELSMGHKLLAVTPQTGHIIFLNDKGKIEVIPHFGKAGSPDRISRYVLKGKYGLKPVPVFPTGLQPDRMALIHADGKAVDVIDLSDGLMLFTSNLDESKSEGMIQNIAMDPTGSRLAAIVQIPDGVRFYQEFYTTDVLTRSSELTPIPHGKFPTAYMDQIAFAQNNTAVLLRGSSTQEYLLKSVLVETGQVVFNESLESPAVGIFIHPHEKLAAVSLKNGNILLLNTQDWKIFGHLTHTGVVSGWDKDTLVVFDMPEQSSHKSTKISRVIVPSTALLKAAAKAKSTGEEKDQSKSKAAELPKVVIRKGFVVPEGQNARFVTMSFAHYHVGNLFKKQLDIIPDSVVQAVRNAMDKAVKDGLFKAAVVNDVGGTDIKIQVNHNYGERNASVAELMLVAICKGLEVAESEGLLAKSVRNLPTAELIEALTINAGEHSIVERPSESVVIAQGHGVDVGAVNIKIIHQVAILGSTPLQKLGITKAPGYRVRVKKMSDIMNGDDNGFHAEFEISADQFERYKKNDPEVVSGAQKEGMPKIGADGNWILSRQGKNEGVWLLALASQTNDYLITDVFPVDGGSLNPTEPQITVIYQPVHGQKGQRIANPTIIFRSQSGADAVGAISNMIVGANPVPGGKNGEYFVTTYPVSLKIARHRQPSERGLGQFSIYGYQSERAGAIHGFKILDDMERNPRAGKPFKALAEKIAAVLSSHGDMQPYLAPHAAEARVEALREEQESLFTIAPKESDTDEFLEPVQARMKAEGWVRVTDDKADMGGDKGHQGVPVYLSAVYLATVHEAIEKGIDGLIPAGSFSDAALHGFLNDLKRLTLEGIRGVGDDGHIVMLGDNEVYSRLSHQLSFMAFTRGYHFISETKKEPYGPGQDFGGDEAAAAKKNPMKYSRYSERYFELLKMYLPKEYVEASDAATVESAWSNWKQGTGVEQQLPEPFSGNVTQQGIGSAGYSFDPKKENNFTILAGDKMGPAAFNLVMQEAMFEAAESGEFRNGLVYEIWDLKAFPKGINPHNAPAEMLKDIPAKRIFLDAVKDRDAIKKYLADSDRFSVRNIWSKSNNDWDVKNPKAYLDRPIASASVTRLGILSGGEYLGKDDPLMIGNSKLMEFVYEWLSEHPLVVQGDMNGSHWEWAVLVSMEHSIATFRSFPILTMARYTVSSDGKKIVHVEDLFKNRELEKIKDQAHEFNMIFDQQSFGQMEPHGTNSRTVEASYELARILRSMQTPENRFLLKNRLKWDTHRKYGLSGSVGMREVYAELTKNKSLLNTILGGLAFVLTGGLISVATQHPYWSVLFLVLALPFFIQSAVIYVAFQNVSQHTLPSGVIARAGPNGIEFDSSFYSLLPFFQRWFLYHESVHQQNPNLPEFVVMLTDYFTWIPALFGYSPTILAPVTVNAGQSRIEDRSTSPIVSDRFEMASSNYRPGHQERINKDLPPKKSPEEIAAFKDYLQTREEVSIQTVIKAEPQVPTRVLLAIEQAVYGSIQLPIIFGILWLFPNAAWAKSSGSRTRPVIFAEGFMDNIPMWLWYVVGGLLVGGAIWFVKFRKPSGAKPAKAAKEEKTVKAKKNSNPSAKRDRRGLSGLDNEIGKKMSDSIVHYPHITVETTTGFSGADAIPSVRADFYWDDYRIAVAQFGPNIGLSLRLNAPIDQHGQAEEFLRTALSVDSTLTPTSAQIEAALNANFRSPNGIIMAEAKMRKKDVPVARPSTRTAPKALAPEVTEPLPELNQGNGTGDSAPAPVLDVPAPVVTEPVLEAAAPVSVQAAAPAPAPVQEDERNWKPVSADDLKKEIKFGTAGWRTGLLMKVGLAHLLSPKDDVSFTLDNVSRLAQGIANMMIERGGHGPIAVGFDARPKGREFAKRIVEVLAANGIPADLIDQVTPTPIMAEATAPGQGYALAVHVTASHNAVYQKLTPEVAWQGIKVLQNGIPGTDALTSAIAAKANDPALNKRYKSTTYEALPESVSKRKVDLIAASNARLRTAFEFEELKKKIAAYKVSHPNFGILIDSMHGATIEAAKIFAELGILDAHYNTTPIYEGKAPRTVDVNGKLAIWAPDPTKPEFFSKDSITPQPGKLLARLDGDGDRAVATDIDGERILTPNELGLIKAHYLWTVLGERGSIIRTLPSTRLLDRLAKKLGTKLIQTPVGSKNFAPYVDETLVAVEESGHIFFKRKGVLFADSAVAEALLLLEIIVTTGKSLNQYLTEIKAEIGDLEYNRTAVDKKYVTDEFKAQILDIRANRPALFATKLAESLNAPLLTENGEVKAGVTYDTTDPNGVLVYFEDGSWAMYKLSGTDGSVRIYGEAPNKAELAAQEAAVEKILVELTQTPPASIPPDTGAFANIGTLLLALGVATLSVLVVTLVSHPQILTDLWINISQLFVQFTSSPMEAQSLSRLPFAMMTPSIILANIPPTVVVGGAGLIGSIAALYAAGMVSIWMDYFGKQLFVSSKIKLSDVDGIRAEAEKLDLFHLERALSGQEGEAAKQAAQFGLRDSHLAAFINKKIMGQTSNQSIYLEGYKNSYLVKEINSLRNFSKLSAEEQGKILDTVHRLWIDRDPSEPNHLLTIQQLKDKLSDPKKIDGLIYEINYRLIARISAMAFEVLGSEEGNVSFETDGEQTADEIIAQALQVKNLHPKILVKLASYVGYIEENGVRRKTKPGKEMHEQIYKVIYTCVSNGVVPNITLGFGPEYYATAVMASMDGLKDRMIRIVEEEKRAYAILHDDWDGNPKTPELVSNIKSAQAEAVRRFNDSVFSYFASRYDVFLEKILPKNLAGKVGIAMAQLTYKSYKYVFLDGNLSPKMERLFGQHVMEDLANARHIRKEIEALTGVRPLQRYLHASTETKNKTLLSPVLYIFTAFVNAINGLPRPVLVNTLPLGAINDLELGLKEAEGIKPINTMTRPQPADAYDENSRPNFINAVLGKLRVALVGPYTVLEGVSSALKEKAGLDVQLNRQIATGATPINVYADRPANASFKSDSRHNLPDMFHYLMSVLGGRYRRAGVKDNGLIANLCNVLQLQGAEQFAKAQIDAIKKVHEEIELMKMAEDFVAPAGSRGVFEPLLHDSENGKERGQWIHQPMIALEHKQMVQDEIWNVMDGSKFNVSELVFLGMGGESSVLGDTSVNGGRKVTVISGTSHREFEDFENNPDRLSKSHWYFVSKSFSTSETIENLDKVIALYERHGLDPKKHITIITDPDSKFFGGKYHQQGYRMINREFTPTTGVGGRNTIANFQSVLAFTWLYSSPMIETLIKNHDFTGKVDQWVRAAAGIAAAIKAGGRKICIVLPEDAAFQSHAPALQQNWEESLGLGMVITTRPNLDKIQKKDPSVIFIELQVAGHESETKTFADQARKKDLSVFTLKINEETPLLAYPVAVYGWMKIVAHVGAHLNINVSDQPMVQKYKAYGDLPLATVIQEAGDHKTEDEDFILVWDSLTKILSPVQIQLLQSMTAKGAPVQAVLSIINEMTAPGTKPNLDSASVVYYDYLSQEARKMLTHVVEKILHERWGRFARWAVGTQGLHGIFQAMMDQEPNFQMVIQIVSQKNAESPDKGDRRLTIGAAASTKALREEGKPVLLLVSKKDLNTPEGLESVQNIFERNRSVATFKPGDTGVDLVAAEADEAAQAQAAKSIVASHLREGFKVLTLQDPESLDTFEIIPGLGGNVVSLKVNGRQILFNPSENGQELSLLDDNGKPRQRGMPFLFPWIGPIFNHETINGRGLLINVRSLQTPRRTAHPDEFALHGLALALPWQVESTRPGSVTVVLDSSKLGEEQRKELEFVVGGPVRVRVTYTLKGGEFNVVTELTNLGDQAVQVAFGHHVNLNMPHEETMLQAPASEFWASTDLRAQIHKDSVNAQNGKYDFRQERKLGLREAIDVILTSFGLDPVFTVVDRKDKVQVQISHDGKIYKNSIIWRVVEGVNKGVLGVEPLTSPKNAANLGARGQQSDLVTLPVGERVVTQYKIRVTSLAIPDADTARLTRLGAVAALSQPADSKGWSLGALANNPDSAPKSFTNAALMGIGMLLAGAGLMVWQHNLAWLLLGFAAAVPYTIQTVLINNVTRGKKYAQGLIEPLKKYAFIENLPHGVVMQAGVNGLSVDSRTAGALPEFAQRWFAFHESIHLSNPKLPEFMVALTDVFTLIPAVFGAIPKNLVSRNLARQAIHAENALELWKLSGQRREAFETLLNRAVPVKILSQISSPAVRAGFAESLTVIANIESKSMRQRAMTYWLASAHESKDLLEIPKSQFEQKLEEALQDGSNQAITIHLGERGGETVFADVFTVHKVLNKYAKAPDSIRRDIVAVIHAEDKATEQSVLNGLKGYDLGFVRVDNTMLAEDGSGLYSYAKILAKVPRQFSAVQAALKHQASSKLVTVSNAPYLYTADANLRAIWTILSSLGGVWVSFTGRALENVLKAAEVSSKHL